jgi:hypothetical protein
VADGRVYGMCRNRERFADYQAFLLGVTVPEALRRGAGTRDVPTDAGVTSARSASCRIDQPRLTSFAFSHSAKSLCIGLLLGLDLSA